ncbi:MAG: mycothiol synthase [Nocardioidaceae bacterium]|nr:mycothiol synthase [Nocardioidaceae bacterium]
MYLRPWVRRFNPSRTGATATRLSQVNAGCHPASRSHRIERLDALAPADARAVRALVADATAHDGHAPLNEHALLHLRHPEAGASKHLLGRDDDTGDELAGYLYLDVSRGGPVQAECVVAPAQRRQGWGRALVSTAVKMVAPRPVQLWSHGADAAADRLAESLGFRRVRELWQMRRDLRAELPTLGDVAGVRVRGFRPGVDEGPWLALNARAFAHHPEQGQMTRSDLDRRMSEPWFDPDGFFVAEREGELIGFHWTKIHGDPGDGSGHGHPVMGEVYVVGVDPAAQGAGLGRLLTLTGLHHLREKGLDCVLLFVEADNSTAIAVYRRLGFSHVATDALYRLDR